MFKFYFTLCSPCFIMTVTNNGLCKLQNQIQTQMSLSSYYQYLSKILSLNWPKQKILEQNSGKNL